MRSRLLLPSSLGFSPDARNRSDPSSLLPPLSGFSPTHAGPRYHIHPHHRHASTPDRCPQENSLLQIVHKTDQAAHARRQSPPAPLAKLTAKRPPPSPYPLFGSRAEACRRLTSPGIARRTA